MALLPVENIGSVGIHCDPPAYSLPPTTWSDGINVRFTDQGVKKLPGYKSVMDGFPTNRGTPQHIVFRNASNQAGDSDMWFVFTDSHIMSISNESQVWNTAAYLSDGSSQKDIWSTAWKGPILLATNGKSMWQLHLVNGKPTSPVQFNQWTANSSQEAGVVFNALGTFKSHIIGMGTNDNPYRVWWSTAMSAYEEVGTGSSANQFDYLDQNKDSGDFELNETRGSIVGGAQLGDGFIVYKEDCAYVMNYIGQPFIFGFKVMAKDIGLLNKRAIGVFDGGHIFIGVNDVHINNGQSIMPVLMDKLQTDMFGNMNHELYQKAFVETNRKATEAIIMWPDLDTINTVNRTQDNKWCNRGIMFNWMTGTLTKFKPQKAVHHACEGISRIEDVKVWGYNDELYNDYGGTWEDAGSEPWNEDDYGVIAQHLVLCDGESKKFYRTNVGETEDGADMFSGIERIGYDLGDPGGVKFVRAVYPKMEVAADNSVDVYVCGQMSPEDAIRWEGPYTFNPDKNSKVSCRVSGKYFGVKFESTGDFSWRLHGYEFDMEQSGRRGSRTHAV